MSNDLRLASKQQENWNIRPFQATDINQEKIKPRAMHFSKSWPLCENWVFSPLK